MGSKDRDRLLHYVRGIAGPEESGIMAPETEMVTTLRELARAYRERPGELAPMAIGNDACYVPHEHV